MKKPKLKKPKLKLITISVQTLHGEECAIFNAAAAELLQIKRKEEHENTPAVQ